MKQKIPTWMIITGVIILAVFLFGGKPLFDKMWDIFDPADDTEDSYVYTPSPEHNVGTGTEGDDENWGTFLGVSVPHTETYTSSLIENYIYNSIWTSLMYYEIKIYPYRAGGTSAHGYYTLKCWDYISNGWQQIYYATDVLVTVVNVTIPTNCISPSQPLKFQSIMTGTGKTAESATGWSYYYEGKLWYDNLKSDGESCTAGTECSSGFCVHSVCRATSPFCGDIFCDAGETSSSCLADCPLLPNGATCSANSECASNFCVHNTCRAIATYCGDAYCDSGETASSCSADCAIILKADGQSCTNNPECSSTFCINSVCSAKTADPDNDLLFNSFENLTTKTDPADADTDNDGMPDGWEYINGLNPLVNDANLDKDGDGITNLAEYTAGTDPQSAIVSAPAQTTTTTPVTTAAGITPTGVSSAEPTGFFGEITKRLSIFWLAIIGVIAVIYFIGTKKKGKRR